MSMIATASRPEFTVERDHMPISLLGQSDFGEGRFMRMATDEPSHELLERGRKFGAWFRAALKGSGMTVVEIANAVGLSRQTLYIYRNDCVRSDGSFLRVGEDVIRKIAVVTHANIADGLHAFGFEVSGAAAPQPVLNLPLDAQQTLARFVEMVGRGPLERVPELAQVLDAFEGVPVELRKDVADDLLKRIEQAANRDYHNRTDIHGKLPPGEMSGENSDADE